MKKYTEKLILLCDNYYPKITRKIINDKFIPPQKIRILFRKHQENPGETIENQISLSSDWFRQNPQDTGAFIHELAHVAQAYQKPHPFWVREGMADSIRYGLGFQSGPSYAHCGPGSEHYTDGYWCSAALLIFIEQNFEPKILSKLNKTLREGTYKDSFFHELTGKNIDELWRKCLNADCKGGRP